MRPSLLHLLAAAGAFLLVTATSSAHAQASLSSGILQGGDLAAGQTRSWAVNVPAGNYLAIGRVSYRLRSGQQPASLQCQIKRGAGTEFWDIEEASITGNRQGGQIIEGEITLLGQIPFPTAGSLAIECRATGGTQHVTDVRLELMQASSLGDLTVIDTSGPAVPVNNVRNGVAERHN